MNIHFFEEYPTQKNMKQLQHITFPTRVYVATQSIRRFKTIQQKVEKKNRNVEVAYWPILEESYWISPFSNPKELKQLEKELYSIRDGVEVKVLLDLELPLKKPVLFLKNIKYFRIILYKCIKNSN